MRWDSLVGRAFEISFEREMRDSRAINRVIKMFSAGEMGERGRKGVDWLIEVPSKREMVKCGKLFRVTESG